jgi:beta-glucosidase
VANNFALVVNEPEVFAFEIFHHSQNKNIFSKIGHSLRVYWQLIKIHKLAFRVIKKIDPVAQVGIAKNVAYHEPFRKNNLFDKFLVSIANTFSNELFVRLIQNQLDFIGLNYYFYHSLQWSWSNIFKRQNKYTIKSDMGEKTFPKGLYYVLTQFWKFKKPLFVTENGIGNSRDGMRIRFIEEHLQAVLLAKQEGVDARGYFYWSLTDTYEWKSGYDIKFGLVEIDYQTGQRRVRQNFNKEKLQQLLNKLG